MEFYSNFYSYLSSIPVSITACKTEKLGILESSAGAVQLSVNVQVPFTVRRERKAYQCHNKLGIDVPLWRAVRQGKMIFPLKGKGVNHHC